MAILSKLFKPIGKFLGKVFGKSVKYGSKVITGATIGSVGSVFSNLFKGLKKGISNIFSSDKNEENNEEIDNTTKENNSDNNSSQSQDGSVTIINNQDDDVDNSDLNKAVSSLKKSNELDKNTRNLSQESSNLSKRSTEIINRYVNDPISINKPVPKISNFGYNKLVLEPEQIAQIYHNSVNDEYSKKLLELVTYGNELSNLTNQQLTLIVKYLSAYSESNLVGDKLYKDLVSRDHNDENSINEKIEEKDKNNLKVNNVDSKEDKDNSKSESKSNSINKSKLMAGLISSFGIGLPILNTVIDKFKNESNEDIDTLSDNISKDIFGDYDKSSDAEVKDTDDSSKSFNETVSENKTNKTIATAGTIAGAAGLATYAGKQVAKDAVKVTTESGVKALSPDAAKVIATKLSAKLLSKQGPKFVLKKFPVIGALMGAGFAVHRLTKGDYLGALGELLSGAASTVPGVGTGASLGIDLALALRDGYNELENIKETGKSKYLTDEELNEILKEPTKDEIEYANYIDEKSKIVNKNSEESWWDKLKYNTAKTVNYKSYVSKVNEQRSQNDIDYNNQIAEITKRYETNPESFNYVEENSNKDDSKSLEVSSDEVNIGSKETTKSQRRASRNNNPGNLRPNVGWLGQVPLSEAKDKGYAQFTNMGYGVRALFKNLATYKNKYGIDTIRGAISKWAPASDNNNTDAYIARVSKSLGVGPDDKIDLEDKRVAFALADIIYKTEADNKHSLGKADLEFGWLTKNDTKLRSKEEIDNFYANYDKNSIETESDLNNSSKLMNPNLHNDLAQVKSDNFTDKFQVPEFTPVSKSNNNFTVTKDEVNSNSNENLLADSNSSKKDINNNETNNINQVSPMVINGGNTTNTTNITNNYYTLDRVNNNESYG